jgi:hypothetical protein
MEKKEAPEQIEPKQKNFFKKLQAERQNKKKEKLYSKALLKACTLCDMTALQSIPLDVFKKIVVNDITYQCRDHNKVFTKYEWSQRKVEQPLATALNYSAWDVAKYILVHGDTVRPSAWDINKIITLYTFSAQEKVLALTRYADSGQDINYTFAPFWELEPYGFMDHYLKYCKERINYHDPLLIWFIEHMEPCQKINNVVRLFLQTNFIDSHDFELNQMWMFHSIKREAQPALKALKASAITTLACLRMIMPTQCPSDCKEKGHSQAFHKVPKPITTLLCDYIQKNNSIEWFDSQKGLPCFKSHFLIEDHLEDTLNKQLNNDWNEDEKENVEKAYNYEIKFFNKNLWQKFGLLMFDTLMKAYQREQQK